MAKINIAFDTKDKTMAVTMDGKSVANVVGAYLGTGYDDDCRCELMMAEKNEEDGYYTMTRIVAAESGEGKKLAETAPDSKAAPGFKVAEVSAGQLEAEVAAYFKKAREPRKTK
jgi:hypothetical protein